MSVHQVLYDGDEIKRVQFCRQMLNLFRADPTFHERLLCTDECLFKLSGSFNRQNYRFELFLHSTQDSSAIYVPIWDPLLALRF